MIKFSWNFDSKFLIDRYLQQNREKSSCLIGDTCHQIPPNIDSKWIAGNEAVIRRLK